MFGLACSSELANKIVKIFIYLIPHNSFSTMWQLSVHDVCFPISVSSNGRIADQRIFK